LTSYLSIFIFTFLVVPFRELQDTQTLSQGVIKMKEELQDTFQEWVKTDSEKAYISLEIGDDGHVLHLPISYATLDADGDLVINAYGLTPDHIKTHLVER